MSATNMNKFMLNTRLLLTLVVALLLSAVAQAATPGITGPSFNLIAQPAYLNQPDGSSVYSWGYGCNGAPTGFAPTMANQTCPSMQVPGPTLIVTEGNTVTVTLTNGLPASAGNTSILFSGFSVTATGGVPGLLTQEAAPGGTVTYTFTALTPGTHSYYSGTQGDLQIEMGLYGAIIVLPAAVPSQCTTGLHAANITAEGHWGETDFRLSQAAYDHPATCYDREYLFQFAEMDSDIHRQAEAQVATAAQYCASGPTTPGCSLNVPTEPYHPGYFLINGRSMPDDMDGNYAPEYPHQPYNGNPHMHPGEQVLLRVIGQGRWEHPFHEHANHVRILARDGNLLLTPDGQALAGILMFTTDTFPGQSFDGLFYFTGRGLNWDMYAHNPGSSDPNAVLPCTPDANGYNTGAPTAINFWEWCQDHNKPLQVAPFGDVAAGGPATLPDANILTNGAWFSGSPYLGPDATTRATGPNSVYQPSNTQANPANERGFAFMWHSHNEREITTNNVFPGGMLMMMLVDSREFVIDESN
jgi:hypothetical protein